MLFEQKLGGVGWEKILIEIWIESQTKVRKTIQLNPESEGFPDKEGDKRIGYGKTKNRKKGSSRGWESESRGNS